MVKRKKPKFPEGTLCAFCSERPAVEPEHVIAECFNESKEGLITVPACSECNREKSKEDVYLLHFVVGDMRVNHPVAIRINDDSVARAVKYDRNAIPRSAVRRPPPQPVRIPGTLQLYKLQPPDTDFERVCRGIRWIIRGLHYAEYGRRLPETLVLDVTQLHPADAPAAVATFEQLGSPRRRVGRAGDEIFDYMVFTNENTVETEWLCWFYSSGSHCFHVKARIPVDAEEQPVCVISPTLWAPVTL